jgi:hypothetical protein
MDIFECIIVRSKQASSVIQVFINAQIWDYCASTVLSDKPDCTLLQNHQERMKNLKPSEISTQIHATKRAFDRYLIDNHKF